MTGQMDRRELIKTSTVIGAMTFGPSLTAFSKPELLTKKIPKTGEPLPAIGMGTWISFNVGGSKKLKDFYSYLENSCHSYSNYSPSKKSYQHKVSYIHCQFLVKD